jgi:hypothetical protein
MHSGQDGRLHASTILVDGRRIFGPVLEDQSKVSFRVSAQSHTITVLSAGLGSRVLVEMVIEPKDLNGSWWNTHRGSMVYSAVTSLGQRIECDVRYANGKNGEEGYRVELRL